jgi:hypothetical protein
MINIAGFEDSCHNKKIASKASITMKKRHGLFILSFLPTFYLYLILLFLKSKYHRSKVATSLNPKRKEATSASFNHS